jgi:hypothetical protein
MEDCTRVKVFKDAKVYGYGEQPVSLGDLWNDWCTDGSIRVGSKRVEGLTYGSHRATSTSKGDVMGLFSQSPLPDRANRSPTHIQVNDDGETCTIYGGYAGIRIIPDTGGAEVKPSLTVNLEELAEYVRDRAVSNAKREQR